LYKPPGEYFPTFLQESDERKLSYHRTDIWMLGITFGQLCNMEALCEESKTHQHVKAKLRQNLESAEHLRPPLFDNNGQALRKDEYERLKGRWCVHACSEIVGEVPILSHQSFDQILDSMHNIHNVKGYTETLLCVAWRQTVLSVRHVPSSPVHFLARYVGDPVH
jgi:hypothetical protein